MGTGASYKRGTTKFNGVLVYSGTDYSSSSNVDQLHWNGSKCYILYANLTKIYCYGYTDGEIATNCASGGIWEGISVSNVTKVD